MFSAAVNYLASLGSRFGGVDADGTRRQHIEAGMQVIAAHERDLKRQFLKGAENIRGLHLMGVTDVANGLKARTATFAVAKTGMTGAELAESFVRARSLVYFREPLCRLLEFTE